MSKNAVLVFGRLKLPDVHMDCSDILFWKNRRHHRSTMEVLPEFYKTRVDCLSRSLNTTCLKQDLMRATPPMHDMLVSTWPKFSSGRG